jgi:hypothetical protein
MSEHSSVFKLLTQTISVKATWRRSNKERSRHTAHNKTDNNEPTNDRQNIYHDINDVKKLQTKTKKAEEHKSSPLIPRISANCTLNKIEVKRH